MHSQTVAAREGLSADVANVGSLAAMGLDVRLERGGIGERLEAVLARERP